jgi:hypothetical protein
MAGIFSYTQTRTLRRVASKVSHEQEQSPPCRRQETVTIFGPDFPFAFDDWIEHPAGLGSIPGTTMAKKWRLSAPASPAWWRPTS